MAALKVLREVTACIYKGEEKPVMKWSFLTKVENKDLKSFLQALNAFGVDQRAKELGIQDYKLKLQCKRLTPEGTNERNSEDGNAPITAGENHPVYPITAEHSAL